MSAVLRILGIDPGLQITGFGIIDRSGTRIGYVASGCVKTREAPLPQRLKTIVDGLAEIIAEYRPQEAAIEQVFVNVNPKATLSLGQARGAGIVAAVQAGLPVSEYTALQVKKSVVGAGHAQKVQVQEMVMRLLGLPGAPGPDAADALACAICHAHASKLGAISTRGYRMKRGRLV